MTSPVSGEGLPATHIEYVIIPDKLRDGERAIFFADMAWPDPRPWVCALCIDVDVASQGRDYEEAKTRLQIALDASLEIARAEGFSLPGPAPKRYENAYNRATGATKPSASEQPAQDQSPNPTEASGNTGAGAPSPRPSATDEEVERVARAVDPSADWDGMHWAITRRHFSDEENARLAYRGYQERLDGARKDARAAIAAMSSGTPAQRHHILCDDPHHISSSPQIEALIKAAQALFEAAEGVNHGPACGCPVCRAGGFLSTFTRQPEED